MGSSFTSCSCGGALEPSSGALGCCKRPPALQPEFSGGITAPRELREQPECSSGPSASTEAPRREEESEESIPGKFTLEIHHATLDRTFAKVGWMDPYAVVALDEHEFGRTKADRHAHRSPHWDAQFSLDADKVPCAVTIAVWDKNTYHKDVFCGSVTIPCSGDMGALVRKDFELTKRSRTTGHISLTLRVEPLEGVTSEETIKRKAGKQVTLGCELDDLVNWSRRNQGVPKVTLKEVAHTISRHDHGSGEYQEEEEEEEKDEEDLPVSLILTNSCRIVAPTGDKMDLAIMGAWKCVDTWNMEEFLKSTGVSVFQRKIALAAKWPAWEYAPGAGKVIFINHSAIGDLREEFPLGEEYSWRDGHRNVFTCKAEWQLTSDGGVLITTRSGALGIYTEERKIANDILEFTLKHFSGVSWGRRFERA